MIFLRLLKWSALGLGGLLLILLLALAGTLFWLRGSLPQTEGEVQVASPVGEVEILRDPQGLVTIRAQSHADAIYGLGYAHAQDRLAQMELMRRLGTGRTAEVVGRMGLRGDQLFRQLEFARLSQAAIEHLEPETLAVLESYAAGVNGFLASHSGPLPPEFLLAGKPEPWEPWHSVLWGKLMALQLSGNWREELQNARLATRLSAQEMAELFPEQPADAPATFTEAMRLAAAAPSLLEALPQAWQERRGASNAWALSGEHTQTGAPLLANDPHLGLGAPGTWYLARLETPEGVWAGATAPGVPGVVIGHNGHVAWGFTTTHSDTQDLVIERLVEGDPDHYQTPDGPRAFETWEEEIAVRGSDPEVVTFRKGRFGPVVSQAEADALGRDVALTLAWPALQEEDTSADGLVRLNQARTPADFEAASARFVAPQQNIFFATTEGHIAFAAPALVPIRDGYDGSLPVEGSEREAIWTGFIPRADLPQTVDPPGGRLVNANNRPVEPDYPYLLGTRWPEPYRVQRIESVLEEAGNPDAEAMAALQMDEISLMARDLLPILLAGEAEDPLSADAQALLGAWDGTMDRDRPEPLILWAWLDVLHEGLFAPKLGPLYDELRRLEPRAMKGILERDDGTWCQARATDCSALLEQTLQQALEGLEVTNGEELRALRWGDRHQVRIAHFLLGRIPLLGDLLALELATGGGDYTINRASPSRDPASRFRQVHGPGLRAVFDLADLEASRFSMLPGQSGNPFSPHFDDLARSWRDGETVQLVAPAQAERRRLVLTPAADSSSEE
ncbi:penicillin acylase family protein [Aquibaculum sediminis]|uniref:penicillin acylase family protein n=1 Tax=Aquibaculum sediminis TaxID=3231907 RepID=UPI0034545390